MPDRIGQQLGNYQLVRLLGEGGFAEVYLGQHVFLGTEAAVKVLTTKLADDEIELFRIEARTMMGFEHPNILPVLEFGMDGRLPFTIMRYAPSGSLRKLHPKNTRLPLPTIVSYVDQIAAALQYAHNNKLVHRDIKPENLLVGRNKDVLVSDFGIAVVAHSMHSMTPQLALGTSPYMAPEQLLGNAIPASDQYALGIIVYEWLCGEWPFQGDRRAIEYQHMNVNPPSLRIKIPTISPEVERVVMIALAKDPKQRFRHVTTFARALKQAYEATQLPSIAPPNQPVQTPVVDTPPNQSLSPTVIPPVSSRSTPPTIAAISPNQSSNRVTPVNQRPQTTEINEPSHYPSVLPTSRSTSSGQYAPTPFPSHDSTALPASKRVLGRSGTPQPNQGRESSRKLVVRGLFLLRVGAVLLGIFVLLFGIGQFQGGQFAPTGTLPLVVFTLVVGVVLFVSGLFLLRYGK